MYCYFTQILDTKSLFSVFHCFILHSIHLPCHITTSLDPKWVPQYATYKMWKASVHNTFNTDFLVKKERS